MVDSTNRGSAAVRMLVPGWGCLVEGTNACHMLALRKYTLEPGQGALVLTSSGACLGPEAAASA